MKFKTWLVAYGKACVISAVIYLAMTAFWPEADSRSWTGWLQEFLPLMVLVGVSDAFYRRARRSKG